MWQGSQWFQVPSFKTWSEHFKFHDQNWSFLFQIKHLGFKQSGPELQLGHLNQYLSYQPLT